MSQGDTDAEARRYLGEAIELFLEMASLQEVERRLASEVYITQIEIAGA